MAMAEARIQSFLGILNSGHATNHLLELIRGTLRLTPRRRTPRGRSFGSLVDAHETGKINAGWLAEKVLL